MMYAMMDDIDGGDEIGSGEVYKSFEEMANVSDKLQILNYEKNYLPLTKLPPLHRYYFIVPTNPGEQFFNFASLSSWLIQQCQRDIKMPDETEDPNRVICRILENVREMGAILDFSPSRVKSGCGPDVVSVLDFLTDKAILKRNYEWENPIFPLDPVDDPLEDVSKQLITLEMIEDEVTADEDSETESDCDRRETKADSKIFEDDEEIIASKHTAEEWQLEVEKVLPLLKHTISADSLDWRGRMNQMRSYMNTLNRSTDEIMLPLKQIASDIGSVLGGIRNREVHLTSQFCDRVMDLQDVHMEAQSCYEKQEALQAQVKEKNRIVGKIIDDIKECERQVEECSSNISDTSRVNKAREDIAELKADIIKCNIEIAIIEGRIFRKPEEDFGVEKMVP